MIFDYVATLLTIYKNNVLFFWNGGRFIMGKIEKVWILSICIFLILAIWWAITFPATYSIPLDQSADKALAAADITIFENYKGTQIKINETDVNNTILCSNLNTFIREVGNGTVIKGIAISPASGRLTVTTTYLHPRLLAENYNMYSKPTAVVKYVTAKTIVAPDYYEGASAASVSASEVKIWRNSISMSIGVMSWTIIFAILSAFLLMTAEWCWDKCKVIKRKATRAIKGLISKK